jgi:chromosome partitioning protein
MVPLQTEFFALEGLSQLLQTVRQVRQAANPHLRIDGVVLTMHDARNNLAQQVEADARQTLGEVVFASVIPRNVRVSEAASHGVPVLSHDPGSKGAAAYQSLAREWMARLGLQPQKGRAA